MEKGITYVEWRPSCARWLRGSPLAGVVQITLSESYGVIGIHLGERRHISRQGRSDVLAEPFLGGSHVLRVRVVHLRHPRSPGLPVRLA
jgi:hypothetical protein